MRAKQQLPFVPHAAGGGMQHTVDRSGREEHLKNVCSEGLDCKMLPNGALASCIFIDFFYQVSGSDKWGQQGAWSLACLTFSTISLITGCWPRKHSWYAHYPLPYTPLHAIKSQLFVCQRVSVRECQCAPQVMLHLVAVRGASATF